MSRFEFEAKCVAVECLDGETQLVGFADQKFDTQTYLMLQRAFEHDAQDVEQGMDTFHVEWCSEDLSGYGGIARFVLKADGADVTFDLEAADALGMQQLSISFHLSAPEREALREGLGHIFRDSDCLVVDDA
jgi:hypothetical protein